MKTTEQIAGPLRLAKKYMADGIFNHLVAILEKDWPSSFEERDHLHEILARRANEEYMRRTGGVLGNGGWDYAAFYPDPAPVVSLARELQLPQVYPYAMYELARWYPTGLLYGWDLNVYLRPDQDMLSRADLKCLLEGSEVFRDVLASALDSLKKTHWSCVSTSKLVDKKTCAASAVAWMRHTLNGVTGDIKFPAIRDPLQRLRQMEKDVQGATVPLRTKGKPPATAEEVREGRVCPQCCEKMKQAIVKAREKVWGEVPVMFAMPNA